MALVELATFNSFEAAVTQGRLLAEGVETHLFDFNMSLEGGFIVPARLMVDEEDLVRARRILADL